MSEVPPSGFQQCSGPHVAMCSMPPPNILFTIPPPPVQPSSLVPWWVNSQTGIEKMYTSGMQTAGQVPVDNQVNALRGSASDELWLSSWLARKQRAPLQSRPPSTVVKIFEASKIFKASLKLVRELRQLYNVLESNCTTFSSEEWSEKWRSVAEKQHLSSLWELLEKEAGEGVTYFIVCLVHLMHLRSTWEEKEVNICLAKISDPYTISELKLALFKRKKKRVSQKNERARRRKEKVESADKIRQMHKKIDTWLEDMQESVERSKREESLKIEADQVLSEVTRKKAEARRQLSLLSSLLKLRQLRARTWSSRGENVSVEAGVQFNKVIDSLCQMWEDQLQVYSVEERGLRVMLEGVVEERNQKQERREREIIREWEQLLFGDRRRLHEQDIARNFFSLAERDLEAFILIRSQWDKFIAPQGVPMSSAIPVGWVLPVGPSSEEWEKLLQQEKKVF